MAGSSSTRADALATRLADAAAALIAVVERVDDRAWRHVPSPGVWSIGKHADHVAEAAIYHLWIVRRTIGERVSSRPPPIERAQMTSDHSPPEVVALLREGVDEAAQLIRGLTAEQLTLRTRPPRARDQRLGETIEHVLIGHYDAHRRDIEAKLR